MRGFGSEYAVVAVWVFGLGLSVWDLGKLCACHLVTMLVSGLGLRV